ncbi:MAG: sulfatase [Myxococcota bacterium]
MRRALAGLALATLCACAPAPDPPGPRSVFLVVVDTLRADRLSCYAADAPATPHVDALARDGVRFAQAQAMASWTLPSMAALLTSRWPRELGMIERADDPKWPERVRQQRRLHRMPLREDVDTLAGRFRDAGFATAAFVNQPLLAPRRGFDRGFDHWLQASGAGRVVPRRELGPESRQRWGSLDHAFANDALLVDAFEQWLGAAPPDAPVFAWIHLLTPHRPYLPAEGFAPEGDDPAALYDAEVRAVDSLVGRLRRAIETRRGGEAPVLAFTSDHGEAFGEHGEREHGNTLHAEVMRVPLLLVAPESLSAGRVVDAVAPAIDLAPTLLELAGLPVPSSMRGGSLLARIAGGEDPRPVLAEGMLYGPSERAWIEGGWKLLVDEAEPRPALYALGDDPQERSDLAPREPDRVAAMRARMAAFLADLSRGPRQDPLDPDAETRDALRALGYAD